jgi:hypothetical protein
VRYRAGVAELAEAAFGVVQQGGDGLRQRLRGRLGRRSSFRVRLVSRALRREAALRVHTRSEVVSAKASRSRASAERSPSRATMSKFGRTLMPQQSVSTGAGAGM